MSLTRNKCRLLLTVGIVYVMALVPLGDASAADRCSADMLRQADASLTDARHSWQGLAKHHRQFNACDDGALGEGYSDAVTSLLARRWNTFGVFERIGIKKPVFEAWAIRHVDASASPANLQRILKNTAVCDAHKPKDAVCMAVRRAASKALKEF